MSFLKDPRGGGASRGPVREDLRFVAGVGRFAADMRLPGMLHVAVLPSPYAHALIESIKVADAVAAPGVHAVLTGDELASETEPLRRYIDVPAVRWRPLATDRVRYVGEWVAAVVADSRELAEDAAERIVVDYEPLDVVIDPDEAAHPDRPLIHPDHGTNVLIEKRFEWGPVAEDLERADGSIKRRVRWHRSSTVPIETFGVVAHWDNSRRVLEVWAAVQMPQFPEQIADALRIPRNHVRVHFDIDVGGSYGVKRGIKHAVLTSYLARRLHRPVRFIEDRLENMMGGDFHGPDRIFDIELAYCRDGTILSMKLDVVDDEGAYPGRSPLQLAKPIGSIVGPYRIRSCAYSLRAVCTNKPGQVAVRGFGQSPTNYAIETAIDELARELNIDRIEIRRRNLIQSHEFPYRIPSGTEYDSGDYHIVVDKLLSLSGYSEIEPRLDQIRRRGLLPGVGIATCLEPGGGNAVFEHVINPANEKTTFPEGCRLRVDAAGGVIVGIALSSAGQGHETLVATLAARELGRPGSDIQVVRLDSLSGLPSQSPVGSRMAIMMGAAVASAAAQCRDKLVGIASHVLDTPAADLSYEDGDVRARDGRAMPWRELVDIAHRKQHQMPPSMSPGLEFVSVVNVPNGGALSGPDGTVQMYPCFSFEAHLVLVAVDPDTGHIGIEGYWVVHDCGTVFNEHIVKGMLCGGIAHGIGAALYERFVFDHDGQPLSGTFMDYLLPGLHEVPPIELGHHCTPSPLTSHGQKGTGEAGYMGAPAAVASAVNDALALSGHSVLEVPLTSLAVWQSLQRCTQPAAGVGVTE